MLVRPTHQVHGAGLAEVGSGPTHSFSGRHGWPGFPLRSLLALCLLSLLLTACMDTGSVFEFGEPSSAEIGSELLLFPGLYSLELTPDAEGGTPRLRTAIAREGRGLTAAGVRSIYLGEPHRVETRVDGESWWYNLQRVREGRKPVTDIRRIAEEYTRVEEVEPPDFLIGFRFSNGVLTSVQAPWLNPMTPQSEERAVTAEDVQQFLGDWDRVETMSRGERLLYRYSCLTAETLDTDDADTASSSAYPNGPPTQRFRLTELMLAADVWKLEEGEQRTDLPWLGFDLVVLDTMELELADSGATYTPGLTNNWAMRPNQNRQPGVDFDPEGNAALPFDEALAATDFITFDVGRLASPGAMHASFGWPILSHVEVAEDGEEDTQNDPGALLPLPLSLIGIGPQGTRAYSLFPLRRGNRRICFLVANYLLAGAGNKDQVDSLGLSWIGDLPPTVSELRLRLGEPDSRPGSVRSGLSQLAYDFDVVGAPPFDGTRPRMQMKVRITFKLRTAEQLSDELLIERLPG